MARPCKSPACGQLITWKDIMSRDGIKSGFFVNADGPNKSERHLCNWHDPRASTESHYQEHEQTIDTILSKVSRIESTLAEIKMKIDSGLQIDVRQ